jgi:hypothetical protein
VTTLSKSLSVQHWIWFTFGSFTKSFWAKTLIKALIPYLSPFSYNLHVSTFIIGLFSHFGRRICDDLISCFCFLFSLGFTLLSLIYLIFWSKTLRQTHEFLPCYRFHRIQMFSFFVCYSISWPMTLRHIYRYMNGMYMHISNIQIKHTSTWIRSFAPFTSVPFFIWFSVSFCQTKLGQPSQLHPVLTVMSRPYFQLGYVIFPIDDIETGIWVPSLSRFAIG